MRVHESWERHFQWYPLHDNMYSFVCARTLHTLHNARAHDNKHFLAANCEWHWRNKIVVKQQHKNTRNELNRYNEWLPWASNFFPRSKMVRRESKHTHDMYTTFIFIYLLNSFFCCVLNFRQIQCRCFSFSIFDQFLFLSPSSLLRSFICLFFFMRNSLCLLQFSDMHNIVSQNQHIYFRDYSADLIVILFSAIFLN